MSVSVDSSRWSGRFCLRIALAIASLPCSIASSRRSLENHWPDLVAGPRALDEGQPVAARPGTLRLGGEDLDDVAVVEGALQRDQPAVDPGADAAVADLGVHGVGEVDRGRAGRQGDDVALGGEDVDLGGLEVEAQRVQELARVRGLPLPVEQLAQPGHVVGGAGEVSPLPPRVPSTARSRPGPPCTSSARRRRTRPAGASRGCGSAARPACPRARSPSCAATGTC